MTVIRRATNVDVDQIVQIHLEAFEDFFLSSLGSSFLKTYYTTFINSKEGAVFCAVKDDKLQGFSACSYISKGFNSRLIQKNFIKYFYESFLLLIRNPKAIVRLIKNLNKKSDCKTINDNAQYAELYSIAVCPLSQGEGIGRMLLTATEEYIKCFNSEMSLTTDYYNNEKTIGFYHSRGYEDYYDFIAYPNRRMWRLLKILK